MRTIEGRAPLGTHPHFRAGHGGSETGPGQKCGEEPAHEDKVKRPSKGKEARVV